MAELTRCLLVLALATAAFACSSSSGADPDGGGDGPAPDGAMDAGHDGGVDATLDGTADARRDAAGADGGDGGDGAPVDASDAEVVDAGLSLSELRVTTSADASAPNELVPAFSPVIYDYYVRCASGTNSLVVSMTASTGAETKLLQPTTSGPAHSQTVPVSVPEGQAIVAEAILGSASTQYWVRCLPHDFPAMQWTPHPGAGTPTPGYYLWGSQPAVGGVGRYAIVVDGNGVPVWYQANGSQIYDVDSILPGALSWAGPFEVHYLSPPSTVVILANGQSPDEHELQVAPKGNFYVLWSAEQTGINLTGLTLPLYDGGTVSYGKNSTILACDVLEVDPSGKVLWRWVGTEHFDPAKAMALLTPDLAQPVVEPYHCNAIDVDPANGNLLVSARDMNSVFYIERATGKVLWKVGGTPESKDDAVYVPVASPFAGQHDARLQAGFAGSCSGATGQISLFDDQTEQPDGGPARAVLYDVTVHAADGGGTDCGAPAVDGGATGATVAFEYKGVAQSQVLGSFRVLADGSRTIGWGDIGSPGTGQIFTEVDDLGNDLLDLTCPDGTMSYRVIKIPTSAFSIDVLRATSGM